MSRQWTEDTVVTITDDQRTLVAGNKLAVTSKWSATGGNDVAIWGLCQGSGKNPYRVCIELDEPAYKCSCPSRKFPCKHVMALFLLFARESTVFPASDPPEWVLTWLENRQQRRAKAAQPESNVDIAAQQKRNAAREAKVSAGMAELRLWLCDLMRRGLADEGVQTYEFWDRIAARMVDAQAGAIARRLRNLAGVPFQGDSDWVARLLDEVARLFLLVESYQRIDSLPEEIQADIRTMIGWSYKQDDLIAREGVRDNWLIVTQNYETEERLRARRVWLYGLQSHAMAMLLDFAHGRTPFEGNYPSGQVFEAELIYYPSAYPQRAVVKQRYGPPKLQHDNLVAYDTEDIAEAIDRYASALAKHPWLERFPVGFRAVWPVRKGRAYHIYDGKQRTLPAKFRPGVKPHDWLMKAMSGGQSLPVFGEWDGHHFYPLVMRADNVFYSF